MNAPEVIYSNRYNDGSFKIHIEGLKELIAWLKESDAHMLRGLKKGLKEAAQPVLQKARANASKIADDGTYASSLSISSRQSGASILLRSTDEQAGVKEFAKVGSTYRVKPSDKRRNARRMHYFPVGASRRANPPRVMVPAVNDSVDEVKDRITQELERVLQEAGRG